MEKRLIDYKDLSTSDKIDHIWEYYKFHIIGTGLVILFIFWMLNHYIFNPPPESTLDISVFGIYAQTDVLTELEQSLNEIVVHEDENEITTVEFFSVAEDLDVNTQQATVTKMIGKATLQDFDIMVFEGDFFQNYLQEDVLLPLDDLVTQGFIQVDIEKLLKGTDVDYASDKLYLVDISDHQGFQRILNTSEPIYLGIYSQTKHLEHIQEVIDYVINEFK